MSLLPEVQEAINDPKMAKAIAFLLYFLNDIDEYRAFCVAESIQRIMADDASPMFFDEPIENLRFEMSDGVTRFYHHGKGFSESRTE